MLRPGCLFITGLSASGKSTLSKSIYKYLDKITNGKSVLIDGEEVRERLMSQGIFLGHSPQDREVVSIELARYASQEIASGKIAIVSAICPKSSLRRSMRDVASPMFEVFLRCSPEVCAGRDYKGNYERALKGEINNMIGVNSPYEEHEVELVIDTSQNNPGKCCEILMSEINNFFNLSSLGANDKEMRMDNIAITSKLATL